MHYPRHNVVFFFVYDIVLTWFLLPTSSRISRSAWHQSLRCPGFVYVMLWCKRSLPRSYIQAPDRPELVLFSLFLHSIHRKEYVRMSMQPENTSGRSKLSDIVFQRHGPVRLYKAETAPIARRRHGMIGWQRVNSDGWEKRIYCYGHGWLSFEEWVLYTNLDPRINSLA